MPVDRGGRVAGDRADSYVLAGVFTAWHRSAAATDARWDVDGDRDPGFDDLDEPCGVSDDDYQALLAGARVTAEAAAAERIKAGEPIPGVLLRPGWPLHPWWEPYRLFTIPRVPFFRDDVLYRITADDVVTVNPERTAWYRGPAGRPPAVGCHRESRRAVTVTSRTR
ncbi:hypothetical protein [Mycobacterium sp.]|uniref:hypothetical protein n=1 Tax=Mycobacterium sp. TaxID=1785 RepID=UPI003F98618C